MIRQYLQTMVLGFTLLLVGVGSAQESPSADALEFFKKQVRPVLVEHCFECHSSDSEKLSAGLLLDSRERVLAGGDSGPAVVPADVEGSLLVEAIRYESYEMPPQGKLSEHEIRSLEEWVAMGAPWPKELAPTTEHSGNEFDLSQRKSDHWCWQPLDSPPIPEVRDRSWPIGALDHFILARLESHDIQPAVATDRESLVRRLYQDLIGLPPTPRQVRQFLNDESVEATETLVDELLASPHFGERWGRHWLDLVRYAESRGHEFDNDSKNAFQYRDYVIRAFNADVPYDQLVREHIAGDLLSSPRLNPEDQFNESILGTGFWFLGEWSHSPVDIRKDETDRFDNMIDVMSKTFLGLTVSCARCHDHKFDAIPTSDYYSISGFLQSSDYHQVRFDSIEHNRQVARGLGQVDEKYAKLILAELKSENLTVAIPSSEVERPSSITVDYRQGVTAESNEAFMQDGYLFGEGPRRAGDLVLESRDGKPVLRWVRFSGAASDSIWRGLESTSEPGITSRSSLAKVPGSGRTLRTKTFRLESGQVRCRVRGRGHVVACVDSHRMIAGPLHGNTVREINPNQPWTTLDLSRYVGHRVHLEFTPAADADLSVAFVTQGATPDQLASLVQFESATEERIEQFSGTVESLLSGGSSTAERINEWIVEWDQARAQLRKRIQLKSRLAIAMMDGSGEDDATLIRGDSSSPGSVSPRHFLTAIAGEQPMEIPSGSGRLQLAERINEASNPLTSRVIVNRIWHHLLGRGIVPTPDDFGVLGQRPTHPELLDYLAGRFLADGRSIKQMIRLIVLSRTYQMSSHSNRKALELDPTNQWWHHRPPRRLEGEAIRDQLLVISGRLDKKMFGEPVPIYLTPFMDGRGRPGKSGPLDGEGRRSVYIAVRRNFLSPFMLAFDTPTPFSTMGRRNESNVPAQSLILMNDPLVVELASQWAKRSLKQVEGPSATSRRIREMYVAAFARVPSHDELAVGVQYIEDQASERRVPNDHEPLWSDFAHALINKKEFIFLR